MLLTWSPRDRSSSISGRWTTRRHWPAGTPILALDMYEHSYHIDYGARAADYVDAFMAAINWRNVGHAFTEVHS